MRRRRLMIALVLALLAGVGGAVWWAVVLPAHRMAAVVQRLAAAFTTGVVPEDTFVTSPAEELAAVYAGMGQLRPQVTVGEIDVDGDGSMRVPLAWSWTIHQGKPTWDYTTSVRLVRVGDEWRGEYTPAAVAPGLQPGGVLRATRLTPPRGAILGQGGVPLAWNRPAYRVGIDKTLTSPEVAVSSARTLAGLMGVDADRLAERVEKAGPRAFIEARILRADDPAERALAEKATDWAGVRAIRATYPLGRTSSFARPLLGVVAEATAEQVEKSGGTIRGGDLAGRGGLQEARNHVLAGTTGFVVSIVDAHGVAAEAFRVEALPGADVWTSIDVGLQETAESILAEVGPASALVAIRPSDGAVLAAASGPGGGGLSTATLGQYPPGSTFKIVTSLALLRKGLGPDSPVECTDGVVVDGYRFDNWQGYPASALGSVPLHTALAHSCNAAFINARAQVSQDELARAAAALGLNTEPRLVVGGFLGTVPAEAGHETEHAASTIGQGRVVASPLGMATVAASIAAGHPVSPWLVDGEDRPAPAVDAPVTEAEAAVLRDLLANTPREGRYPALRDLPGVGAKTGTATYGGGGTYHGWLIAIRGDLAVAAFVEDATSGAAGAAPLAAALLRAVG